MSKLNIVSTNEKSPSLPLKDRTRIETEAKYETLWRQNPEKFQDDDAWKKEKNKRLQSLIKGRGKACDLGAGNGAISYYLAENGWEVDSVDISQNALNKIHDSHIRTYKDYIPFTKLEDNQYDLVVMKDLIATIPKNERRIALSEIERLMKLDGRAIISAEIDIYSEDALIRFIRLVETEFDIEEILSSYNYLWIRLPFIKKAFKKSESVRGMLESISRFIWQDQAISHVICLCKKRPVYIPPVEPPTERKMKKTVWE